MRAIMAPDTEVGCFSIPVNMFKPKSEHQNQSLSWKLASHGQETGEAIWG